MKIEQTNVTLSFHCSCIPRYFPVIFVDTLLGRTAFFVPSRKTFSVKVR